MPHGIDTLSRSSIIGRRVREYLDPGSSRWPLTSPVLLPSASAGVCSANRFGLMAAKRDQFLTEVRPICGMVRCVRKSRRARHAA